MVRRTREIGIRLALGAQPLECLAWCFRVGGMTIAGLADWSRGAAFTGRFMTELLFDVNPWDFWSVVVPLTGLVVACTVSGLVPALRATRIDPSTALRDE